MYNVTIYMLVLVGFVCHANGFDDWSFVDGGFGTRLPQQK
jgi:hypothetical protein